MDHSILALVAFIFTSAMTPGPNNIMLMTSGVNFGFWRTLPHMAGVSLGFPLMVLLIGVGFGTTILAMPWFHDAVSFIGIPYLLWLSWHIASAETRHGLVKPGEHEGMAPNGAITRDEPRPMTFLGASAFQWVNAKAWVMAIGMLAVYAPTGYGVMQGVAIVVAINLIIAIFSSITWTAFGSALSTWLKDPFRLRVFNVVMALLLVATLVPPILDLWNRYA